MSGAGNQQTGDDVSIHQTHGSPDDDWHDFLVPMRSEDRLYVVVWSPDGRDFSVVKDEERDRLVPAAYVTADEAERRRARMQSDFPDCHYRVVGFSYG